jgi:hypothetical protein
MGNNNQGLWVFEGVVGTGAIVNREVNRDSRQDDLRLEEEGPWSRCGLPDPQEVNPLSKRLLHGFFFLSAWVAMPLAVLTIHGWAGLIVHGLALSGAAGLLQKATIQTRVKLERLESIEGDGVCASASERT